MIRNEAGWVKGSAPELLDSVMAPRNRIALIQITSALLGFAPSTVPAAQAECCVSQ